jgi:hypothetical protein
MNRREILKHSTLILGYAVTGGTLAGLIGGCKADPKLDWTPQFFTADQAQTLAEICERILPKTDTPGAKDLLVDRFIDAMIHGYFSAEDQEMMRQGMADFEADCQTSHGAVFVKLKPEQQDEILTKWDKAAPPLPPTVWGGSLGIGEKPVFYRKLKELCLLGYFSSEKIGEEVLNYDPIPGQQIGCMPLAEVGKAWSL